MMSRHDISTMASHLGIIAEALGCEGAGTRLDKLSVAASGQAFFNKRKAFDMLRVFTRQIITEYLREKREH